MSRVLHNESDILLPSELDSGADDIGIGCVDGIHRIRAYCATSIAGSWITSHRGAILEYGIAAVIRP